MADELLNVTTGDNYTPATTISNQQADTLELVVANAAVLARFRPYDPERQNLLPFGAEKLITPRSRVYTGVAGVELRSAIAGVPAQVVAYLLGPGDPKPSADAPFDLYLGPAGEVSAQMSLQTGDVFYSARSGSRDGAVLCDGSHYDSISDPSFTNLYNLIGISWGGTGPSDFAVPDLLDRVPVGAGRNTALAATDGIAAADRHATRHRHTVTDPGHAHGVTDPGHAHTVTDPGHSHSYTGSGVPPTASYATGSDTVGPEQTSSATTGIGVNAATTGIGVNAATTGIGVGVSASDPLDTPAYAGLTPYIVK